MQLTRAEIALLAEFVGSPRRVLSRDRLCRAAVGRGAGHYDRNIDMLVARLRRKIEPNPKAPRFILSVPGVGYKFAVQPQTGENIDALPATDLEISNQSGLREAKPVTALGQGITLRHSEPEKRQVTALSCVLVGPAALADPEDLVGIVQRFQEICTTVITNWGGVVVNLVGDEILALFGYPTGHEDDAERAVHAGLDLVANVGKLPSSSGKALQTRIGIATGLVLIGERSDCHRRSHRHGWPIAEHSAPNSVNVAASTHKLLGSMFVCEDPPLREFEGVCERVTAYRITGKRAIESRFDARRTGKRTEFVGRQHELQQIGEPSGSVPRAAKAKSRFFAARPVSASPVSARLV